jgi:hypothetical protein
MTKSVKLFYFRKVLTGEAAIIKQTIIQKEKKY